MLLLCTQLKLLSWTAIEMSEYTRCVKLDWWLLQIQNNIIECAELFWVWVDWSGSRGWMERRHRMKELRLGAVFLMRLWWREGGKKKHEPNHPGDDDLKQTILKEPNIGTYRFTMTWRGAEEWMCLFMLKKIGLVDLGVEVDRWVGPVHLRTGKNKQTTAGGHNRIKSSYDITNVKDSQSSKCKET